jgi:hypothetical protein
MQLYGNHRRRGCDVLQHLWKLRDLRRLFCSSQAEAPGLSPILKTPDPAPGYTSKLSHSETEGQTERVNATHSDAIFQPRSSSPTMDFIPAGRRRVEPAPASNGPAARDAEQLAAKGQAIAEFAKAKMTAAQAKYSQQANKKRRPARSFRESQEVYRLSMFVLFVNPRAPIKKPQG